MNAKQVREREDIEAAHRLQTNRHAIYNEAMRLVGERHAKGDLVELVNWLLYRAENAEAEVVALTARIAELAGCIVLNGWWCLPCSSWNGEEHSKRTECRSCGRPKTVRSPETG